MEFEIGDLPETTGCMATLNHEGDTKYTWDRDNPIEVEQARVHFNAMKAKGWLVFKVQRGRRGPPARDFGKKQSAYIFVAKEGKTEIAHKFDAKADYIAAPAVSGG